MSTNDPHPVNIVEMIADQEDCAFDQPCRFGHRVEGHAVYCHNNSWDESPRKCRRSWYTGGETKDEACPGFEPRADAVAVNSVGQTNACSKCAGVRRVVTEVAKYATCSHCGGEGIEPVFMPLSSFQVTALESGIGGSSLGPWQRFVVMWPQSSSEDGRQLCDLVDADLLDLHSMGWFHPTKTAYSLVTLTDKGMQILRLWWAMQKSQPKRAN